VARIPSAAASEFDEKTIVTTNTPIERLVIMVTI